MSHGTEHHKQRNHGTEKHKGHCCENNNKEIIDENLVEENIVAITTTVASLNTTMEMLVQKIASMAHHIVAMEEILTEIISENGLSLATVNARIRARIAAGTDNQGDSTMAIDAAASIASVSTR